MEQDLTIEDCNKILGKTEMFEDFNEDLPTQLNTYKEFLKYLAEEAIGKNDIIIEAVNDSETIKFCGYVEIEKIINKKDIYLKFVYNKQTYLAKWQPEDNYAVYQYDDYCDCSYGFMLFPTYNNNKYFLMEYTC